MDLFFLFFVLCLRKVMATPQRFLVGGYNDAIHLAELHGAQLRLIASLPSGANPTFLARNPCLDHVLYAANEIEHGAIDALSLQDHSRLHRISNPSATRGSPAAISVHPSGAWLLFANYFGGSYGVTRIDRHGALQRHPASLIHVPAPVRSSGNPRQEESHPHQIITDSSGKFVFVCDLGTDQVHARVLDEISGDFGANPAAAEIPVEPGSGPRHMIFSRDERFAYVINELANSVSQFAYDPRDGTLRFLESWSTLDQSVANKSACTAAEVAISQDGRFLYASNRGSGDDDSIAVFGVDAGDGRLTLLGLDRVGGSVPRHFAFDRSGEMVVVGLQDSNKVNLLSRDVVTGRLSVIFSLEGVLAPAYIQFL